jgi:hypothetical protein
MFHAADARRPHRRRIVFTAAAAGFHMHGGISTHESTENSQRKKKHLFLWQQRSRPMKN